MKTSIALLAGALLTSAMLAAGGSSNITTGKALTAGSHLTAGGHPVEMSCAKHACCWPKEKTRATGDPWADERFKAKFGRHTPAEEARLKAAQEVYTKNMKNCTEHGCGHQAPAKVKALAAAPPALTADPGFEERFRAKFSRVTPAERLQLARQSKSPAPVAVASAESTCGPDCCKHDM